MPFVMTCPKCQAKNHGKEERPVGRRYHHHITCMRCGKKGIYWVENQETADLIMEQEKAKAEDIAIGVGQSEITYFEPKTADGSDAAIVAAMLSFATLTAPFSQGTRHRAFTPQNTEVAEGQCEGQSLHWIRRVLQGGQETYQVRQVKDEVLREDELLVEHQRKQSRQGAITHQLVSKAHKSPGKDPKIEDLEREHADKRQQILKIFHKKRIDAGFTHKGGDSWEFPADKSPDWKTLQDLQATYLEKHREACRRVLDRTREERGLYVYTWEQLAEDIDRALERSKIASKNRPYSNIAAFKCSNQAPYSSVDAFVDKALTDVDFVADTCVLVSVGLSKGTGEAGGSISGHAIAAHFKSATECYLFDPNIGVFSCLTTAKLIGAMKTLIGKVWTENLSWTLDGEYGFTFFRLKEGVRAHKSKGVIYTASPPVTAKENAVAGGVLPSAPAEKSSSTPSAPPRPKPVLPAPKKAAGGSKSVAELRKNFGGS